MRDRFDWIPIQKHTDLPKLRIDCFGHSAVVYVNGVIIGKGIEDVSFKLKAGETAKIALEGDVDKMEFFVAGKKVPAPEIGLSEAVSES